VKIVAVTGFPKSQIAGTRHRSQSGREERGCPFNSLDLQHDAMLALGDALAMCVLDARGFKKSDYAKLHPAGAIGSTMLVQIKTLCVPATEPGHRGYATVKDALLAMTKESPAQLAWWINADAWRACSPMGIFADRWRATRRFCTHR